MRRALFLGSLLAAASRGLGVAFGRPVVAAALAVPIVLSAADAGAVPRAPAKRAWLGVELAKTPAGAVVAKHVVRTSPAAVAGLQDGDEIASIDGAAMVETRDVVARVAAAGPSGKLKLAYVRAGTKTDVDVALVEHPGADEVLRRDKVGTFAPAWSALTAVKGTVPAGIDKARGKVVLLDFWATWCAPCRILSPKLSKWQDAYGAQGLVVVGITTDEQEVATQSAEAMKMKYAVATDGAETAKSYGVAALPTLYVVDKKGVIRDVVVGYDPARLKEVETLVQTLLAEPGPDEKPAKGGKAPKGVAKTPPPAVEPAPN